MHRRVFILLSALLTACSTTAATSTDTGPLPYAEDTCTGPAEAPWISVTVGLDVACAVASGGCARCWGYDQPGRTDSGTTTGSHLDFLQPESTVRFTSVHLFKGGDSSERSGALGLDPLGFAHGWADVGQTTSSVRFGTLTDGPYQACGPDLEGNSACLGMEAGFPWGEPIGHIQFWRMSFSLWGVLDVDGALWLHAESHSERLSVHWPGPYVAFDVASIPRKGVCAVDTAGALACWNPWGDGVDAPALTGVPEGTFTDVCMTEEGSACALDESGYPVCWGEIDDEPAEALKAIACGSTSVCGITLDGQLRCWGACEYGECDAPE